MEKRERRTTPFVTHASSPLLLRQGEEEEGEEEEEVEEEEEWQSSPAANTKASGTATKQYTNKPTALMMTYLCVHTQQTRSGRRVMSNR